MSVQVRTGHGWVLGRDGTYQPDTTGPQGASCSGPGVCPDCSQEAATAAFRGQPTPVITCPGCGLRLGFGDVQLVRVTEETQG